MTTLTRTVEAPVRREHDAVSSVPAAPLSLHRGASVRRRATSTVVTVLVWAAFACAAVPLVSLLWTLVHRGAERFGWSFLTSDMVGVFGDMTTGGAGHALLGSVLVTLGAAAVSVPVGLLAAVYLVEYGRGTRLARLLTFLVDVMTGIPSIVAGLFAVAVFALLAGPGYRAGVMGSVALSLLMVPVVVRSVEEVLRLVPDELREAALALGAPRWVVIVRIVLRTATSGIVTGIMLAVARVVGETAPLLLTVGLAVGSNPDLLHGRMATLPVFAYRQWAQGGVGVSRAWAAALVLVLLVMLLNVAARLVSRALAPRSGR